MANDLTLALGGGGARGAAHIGVLRVLEREGFRVRALAGTSIGGVIAALYADGHSSGEIEQMIKSVDQTKLYSWHINDGPSLFGLAGVEEWFEKTFAHKTFADLKLPCAVTTVDLRGSCEVILNEGSVADALRATIAVPGIFPPKENLDRLYVDGAVLNPVPVDVARSLAPDLPVVAVVLSPALEAAGRMYKLPIPDSIPRPLADQIKRLRITQAFDIFLDSMDISGRMMTELRLKADRPDVILRPDLLDIGILDVVDISAIAERGERVTLAALPELKRATHWTENLRRRLGLGVPR